MRIFLAGLATETNTFAPLPTGFAGFRQQDGLATMARNLIEAGGHEAVESAVLFAQPSGRTLKVVYETLRDRMLADLAAAGQVDAVLLLLHGAMAAYDYDDCEGDLLARVRKIVGPAAPIGAMLDPHCHMTAAMVANADVLICMKEYPHVDGAARTAEVLDLIVRTAAGEIRPTPALFDTRMLGFYPTTSEPMRGFVDRLHRIEDEEPGVLSVTLGHGFPWADVADVGTRVLVYTDNDPAAARRWAERLGRDFYGLREQLRPRLATIDAALGAAEAGNHLSVIADVADNAGGGAPSDNTDILRRLVERRIAPAALGALFDPGAVDICFEAGVGATFELRIGGKLGRTSGEPIDLVVTVERLEDRLRQTGLAGDPVSLGRSALADADGLKILLVSHRMQTFSPDAFENMGLDLDQMRCVVVKSSQHFHAGFAPRAERILYVAGGGALDYRFEGLPYTKRDLDYFPRVADPLGLAPAAQAS